MKHQLSNQIGSTLMEVMVAIVVMAIGLLGIASLQANALRYQKTASQRSEATQAAYDLSERMRANWAFNLVTPNYAGDKTANETAYSKDQTYAVGSAAAHTPGNDCSSSICTQSQIAANDLEEWQRSLSRRLVGGAGAVVPQVGTSTTTFDVTVMWKEPGFDAADGTCPSGVSAPVGVRCYTLRFSI